MVRLQSLTLTTNGAAEPPASLPVRASRCSSSLETGVAGLDDCRQAGRCGGMLQRGYCARTELPLAHHRYDRRRRREHHRHAFAQEIRIASAPPLYGCGGCRCLPHDARDHRRAEWLQLTPGSALEPALPICDPHHHVWSQRDLARLYRRVERVQALVEGSCDERTCRAVSRHGGSVYRSPGVQSRNRRRAQ